MFPLIEQIPTSSPLSSSTLPTSSHMSSSNLSSTFFYQAGNTDASHGMFNSVSGHQINHLNFAEQSSHVRAFDKFCDRRVASAAFNAALRSNAPKCLPDTRVEVRQQLRQWVDEVHGPPICWLRGPAGSGKSAIAQSIAEEYDERGGLGASFFFDPTSAERRDLTDFIPTLAYQLSIKVPQTKVLMQRAFVRDPSIPDQFRKDQFKKLIVDPLLELGEAVSPKVVVINGLDQYDGEHWVEELVEMLANACQDDRLPLRFFFTSRVDVCFVGLPEASMKRIYTLALENFDARVDIRKFFEAEFEKIHRKNRTGSMRDVAQPWPSHADLDQLVSKSSGLFALASIIVVFVDVTNYPFSKLQAVLASLDGDESGASYGSPHESFIEYLVRLLASSDIGIQAAATAGLANVTSMSGDAKATVNANAIPNLIILLRSRNESVLIGACDVLVNSTTHVDSASVEFLNVLPPLIHLLSSNSILVQRTAIFALMKIITLPCQDPAKNATPILNAIPNFVGLLACQDIKVQASAAFVLQTIVGRGGVEHVVNAKAIPSLVKLLNNSTNSVVLIVACTALRDIIRTFDSVGMESLDLNAIIASLRLLTFSSNVRVQTYATLTLMDITLHDRAVTAVLSSNVVPDIVPLLRSEDIHIQASVAALLENITAPDGKGAQDAVEAKAIPPLVDLLKSPNPTVLIAACAALRNITLTNYTSRSEASRAGAVPLLERLQSSSYDHRIQKSAKAALENITKASVPPSGAIMALMETFTSSATFLSEGLLVVGKEGLNWGRVIRIGKRAREA